MYKLSHLCGLLLLVFLTSAAISNQLLGQEAINFFIESVEASIDDEIAVNVTVENFTNVGGLEISFQWNIDQLDYVGVDNLAFDATPQASLNVSQLDSGRLGFFVADMSLEGFDLEDGATLLTIKYNAIGPDNSVYNVSFGDEPRARVIADTTSTPFEANYFDGTVTVGTPSSVTGFDVFDTRISVSPNPFNDQAQVIVSELGIGPARLSIFDIDGRLVLNRSVSLSGHPQTFIIESADLRTAGVYLLQISTDHGKYSRKLVFRGNGR